MHHQERQMIPSSKKKKKKFKVKKKKKKELIRQGQQIDVTLNYVKIPEPVLQKIMLIGSALT